jgi:NAD+ kinase
MALRWLREQNVANVFMEPRVKAELLEESTDFDFIQTCETGTFREYVYTWF